MPLAYIVTSLILIAYLVGIWILGGYLQLKSPDIWVFRGGFSLLGILAAAGYVWWYRSRRPATDETVEATDLSNEVDLLVRDAETKLGAAKVPQGSKLGNFPLIFLVGEQGSAKTTITVNSGLDPELLAGQVFQDNNVVPTRSANFWFTRNTVFAEAGSRMLGEAGLWNRFVRRARPGKLSSVIGKADQSPRAAVVCVDAETLTKPGAAEALASTARNLHGRLTEISNQLGIRFPVYVVFTRTDRLPFFLDYVRNLSQEEGGQVVGSTLPLGAVAGAIYGDDQTARVGYAFDELFRGLCHARPELLERENDPNVQPGTYEFPRELRKARGLIVRFLVDLCRPSQLSSSPFLRGFYFSGVRPVVVNEYAPSAVAPPPEQKHLDPAAGATGIFHAAQRSQPAAAPQRVTGSRRIPQWVFLGQLFNNLILQDHDALGASSSSTKTSGARRILLACAAALCVLVTIGFVVSYFGNRSLENEALQAARGISSAESTGLDLASLDGLQRLETLRQSLAQLGEYEREGAPWRLRWGLYSGSDMLPHVRKVYFTRFKQLLFAQTQGAMLGTLQRLPITPGPGDEYGPTYETLKGYLITTSHPDKSTRAFLSPVLQRHWMAGRTVDAQRSQLAQKQFDFYSEELKLENPYSKENDSASIERSRRYLSQFAGAERVYQNMLAEANKSQPSLQFNRKFPGSAEVVLDTREVAGAFSKGGFDFMKDAIKHADRYFSGEAWVLGDQTTANFDRAKLEQQLNTRYTQDFIAQWRAYLKAASVVRYASVPDAAKKLNLLAGNQSPLLALFWLASQNTAVADPAIAAAFQPVQTVVPPASVDRYIAPPNQSYMSGLAGLQASLEQVASQPGQVADAAAATILNNAMSAKSATRQVAQAFRPDTEGKVDAMVQKLMEDPITWVEGLVRTLGPAELNGKGKALCGQLRPLMSKYPFNPASTAQATVADVNAILRKPDGALWAFYEANLQKLLPRQGSQYVATPAAGMQLNPSFVAFFNRAASISEAFYPNGAQNPQISYTLKPVPTEGIQGLTLRIDGQVLNTTTPKQFVWPGATHEATASVRFGGTDLGFSSNEGLWAAFLFFDEAERWQPSGANYDLEWLVRAGKKAMTLPSGKPLTVRFELNMGGAPPVFQKGYLSKMGCIADVAK